MNIRYVANIRFPTEKAHGVQIVKMCEAFARAGHSVELIVTDRSTNIHEDPFAYYGVQPNFSIKRIRTPNTLWLGPLGFIVQSYVFAFRASVYMRNSKEGVVYGRDERVLFLLMNRGISQIVWETHTGAWNSAARKVSQRAQRIVAISKGLKDFYVEKGVPAERIVVAHDAIDLDQFAHPESKESARTRLGLPQDKKIAMYIGRLDGWKGVGTLLEASRALPPEWLVVIIGGEPRQVSALSEEYQNVKFLGYRPYTELADNQVAADVLVLPNTGKDEVSVRFTSPLKLFSYMASGVPIVASDLPSIREVLDENSAELVMPDSQVALRDGIEQALRSPGKAAQAKILARGFSWQSRADAVIDSIASC